MATAFQAQKITDDIYWVGAIDWGLRDFHGYATNRGTTYNAYLILSDKITLIDAVKAPFKNEMLARIQSLIEPEKIKFIISNHSEMDHSGCLVEAIEYIKPEKVFASQMGVKALSEHFHHKQNIIAVKDNETVSLGNITLKFMETRMLHWPDSMFTYIPEKEILFSQDAFGMHLASTKRFDDELDWNVLRYELAKYFANILLPYTNFIEKLFQKVSSSNMKFKMVLPDHGPVWRKNFDKVFALYEKWSKHLPYRKAVITFDTMWGSTSKMACAIADGISSKGIDVKVMPLSSSHRSDVATEILDAGALIVGSPTINNNIFPTVADCLTYLKGLRRQNLIGASFGSFGWGGEAVKHLNEMLTGMGIELVGEGLKCKYVPDDSELAKCNEFGIAITDKLAVKCGNN